MTGIGTLLRTVRHLRPVQVFGRARFRLQRPRPDMRPAPPLRAGGGDWVMPARRAASLLGARRLRLLEVEHSLDEVGWDDSRVELLWRYNQHYFDDLNAVDSLQRQSDQRALLQRWLADNPPGRGTGWAPYPTSLRIVNWIKWFIGGTAPEPAWLHSLAVQARWLQGRMEWHLLGNHLFANAKALVYAGLYFDGPEAESWLAQGVAILERELPEQILADGGQFERSPMYHALALEDVLDLLNLCTARASATSAQHRLEPLLRERSPAMLAWLRCLTHPDGTLALFNDTAEGIAPPVGELERFAAALGVSAAQPLPQGISALQPSGYLRVARGAAVALIDAAPIGPDYLPGHAHADTLSFELSLGQRRVVVNRGTSCYGTGARRQFERGTAAHSTVQVGNHDSSEVWAGFRVGRRARPGPLGVDGWTVDASHDGYRHLPGRPTHHRRWRFGETDLRIEDRIAPTAPDSVSHLHLAPGLTLEDAGANRWRVLDGLGALALIEVEAGRAAITDGLHAVRFGALAPAQTLEVCLVDGQARVRISWGADAHSVPL